jgi:ABC-type proline/glycine betaine transport system substrate-binding protein
MTNLLTVYKQMTNLDYSIQYEGQKKTIAQQLTNPQKNTFVFSKAGDMSVVEQPDQVRGRYQYNYSLPNDLWREELKIKGMYRAKSLEETYNGSQFGTEASSNVMTKVQNYLKLDDLQNAQKTLEDYFGLYETALTAADQSYNTDFVANRQTPYLKEMIRRGILKQADIEKLKQIEPDDFN